MRQNIEPSDALGRSTRKESEAAAESRWRWTPGVIASLREEYQQQPDLEPKEFEARITGKPEQNAETGLMLDRVTERLAESIMAT